MSCLHKTTYKNPLICLLMKKLTIKFLLLLVTNFFYLPTWGATPPWNVNLISNPQAENGLNSWTKYSGSWAVTEGYHPYSEEIIVNLGCKGWQTGYETAKLYQSINLTDKGFTAQDIKDAYVHASINYIWSLYNTTKSGDIKTYLKVYNNSTLISEYTLVNRKYEDSQQLSWITAYTCIKLPSIATKVEFWIEGKDAPFWGGNFGPIFTKAVLFLRNSKPADNVNITYPTTSIATTNFDKKSPSTIFLKNTSEGSKLFWPTSYSVTSGSALVKISNSNPYVAQLNYPTLSNIDNLVNSVTSSFPSTQTVKVDGTEINVSSMVSLTFESADSDATSSSNKIINDCFGSSWARSSSYSSSGSYSLKMNDGNNGNLYFPCYVTAGKEYLFKMHVKSQGSKKRKMVISTGSSPHESCMETLIEKEYYNTTGFVRLFKSFTPSKTGIIWLCISACDFGDEVYIDNVSISNTTIFYPLIEQSDANYIQVDKPRAKAGDTVTISRKGNSCYLINCKSSTTTDNLAIQWISDTSFYMPCCSVLVKADYNIPVVINKTHPLDEDLNKRELLINKLQWWRTHSGSESSRLWNNNDDYMYYTDYDKYGYVYRCVKLEAGLTYNLSLLCGLKEEYTNGAWFSLSISKKYTSSSSSTVSGAQQLITQKVSKETTINATYKCTESGIYWVIIGANKWSKNSNIQHVYIKHFSMDAYPINLKLITHDADRDKFSLSATETAVDENVELAYNTPLGYQSFISVYNKKFELLTSNENIIVGNRTYMYYPKSFTDTLYIACELQKRKYNIDNVSGIVLEKSKDINAFDTVYYWVNESQGKRFKNIDITSTGNVVQGVKNSTPYFIMPNANINEIRANFVDNDIAKAVNPTPQLGKISITYLSNGKYKVNTTKRTKGWEFDGSYIAMNTDSTFNIQSQTNDTTTIFGVFKKAIRSIELTNNAKGTFSCQSLAQEGEIVVLKSNPSVFYELKDTPIVTTKSGNAIIVTNNGDNSFSFEMPYEDVVVDGQFIVGSREVRLLANTNGVLKASVKGYESQGILSSINTEPKYLTSPYGNLIEVSHTNKIEGYDLAYIIYRFEELVDEYNELNEKKSVPVTHAFEISAAQQTSQQIDNYQFLMPNADVKIVGLFDRALRIMNIEDDKNGRLHVENIWANVGDTVEINVTQFFGYELNYIDIFDSQNNKVAMLDNNHFVMPNSNVRIKGYFKPLLRNVLIDTQVENGVITTNKQTAINQGEWVNVIAEANKGYRLKQGSLIVKTDDGVKLELNENNAFAMPAKNVIITAEFVESVHNLNIVVNNEHGKVLIKGIETPTNELVEYGVTQPSQFSVQKDSRVIFSQLRKIGYDVAQIEARNATTLGYLEITYGSDTSFVMPAADVTLTITYNAVIKNIEKEANEGCTLYVANTAQEGEEVLIQNKNLYGYELIEYKVINKETNTPIELLPDATGVLNLFTMPHADVVVKAITKRSEHNITTIAPQNGSITIVNGTLPNGKAYVDDVISVEATSNSGYELDKLYYISGYDTIAITNNKFVMPNSDIALSAEFIEVNRGISITKLPNNSSNEVHLPKRVKVGDKVTVGYTLHTDYSLGNIVVQTAGGNNVPIDETNSFVMPYDSVNVTVTFLLKPIEIVTQPCVNGQIIVASKAEVGSNVEVSTIGDIGYKIGSIKATTNSGEVVAVRKNSDNLFAFTMPSEIVKVEAEFVTNILKINIEEFNSHRGVLNIAVKKRGDTKYNQLTQAEAVDIQEGDSVKLTVEPKLGYEVRGIKVDGIEHECENEYRFVMPNHNVQVRALYKVYVDTESPTVVLKTNCPEFTNQAEINFILVYNELVTNFDYNCIVLTNAELTQWHANTNAENYFDTVMFSIRASEVGIIKVRVNQGSAVDNSSNQAITSSEISIYYDNTSAKPIVEEEFYNVQNDYLSLSVNFDRRMSHFNIDAINVTTPNGGITPHEIFDFTTSDSTKFLFKVRKLVDGPSLFSVKAGTATDAMGNYNVASDSKQFYYATYKPSENNTNDKDDNINQSVVYVEPTVGIIDNEENSVALYPNPATNFITIVVGSCGQTNIEILNSSGKLLYTTITYEKQVKIDVSGYSQGVYFVRVVSCGKPTMLKWIKK